MNDFFISYTHADEAWAEWIAFTLEEAGFTTVLQAWDFRPGSNFVLEMQKAASQAQRTIMVLSPDYLQSQFAAPEWAAAFGADPQGMEQKLVPVMVTKCQPSGILTSIVQIRLVGKDQNEAKALLLAGISKKRAKPSSAPGFPGTPPKEFPGADTAVETPTFPNRLLPKIKVKPTDMDRSRFLKTGFSTIKTTFETTLADLERHEPRISTEFVAEKVADFHAEIFLDGTSKCKCRVWQGGAHSENSICYAEGNSVFSNAMNEVLYLSREELSFQASAIMGMSPVDKTMDMRNLSPDQAAEYLWRRFTAPLER